MQSTTIRSRTDSRRQHVPSLGAYPRLPSLPLARPHDHSKRYRNASHGGGGVSPSFPALTHSLKNPYANTHNRLTPLLSSYVITSSRHHRRKKTRTNNEKSGKCWLVSRTHTSNISTAPHTQTQAPLCCVYGVTINTDLRHIQTRHHLFANVRASNELQLSTRVQLSAYIDVA